MRCRHALRGDDARMSLLSAVAIRSDACRLVGARTLRYYEIAREDEPGLFLPILLAGVDLLTCLEERKENTFVSTRGH